ncbi:hypothetical protein ThvES_00008070 [Thiovulum sp. ES]|nr:hypothetical protein ThvES_00008070 [Thiovulum sp. ES]
MPSIVRQGDFCSGHQCFPPRPSENGSPDVLVNSKSKHRVGDKWAMHSCGDPTKGHKGVQLTGSSTVLVNSKPVARVGDLISCTSVNVQGSPDVIAN